MTLLGHRPIVAILAAVCLLVACGHSTKPSRAATSDARWLAGSDDPGPRVTRVAVTGEVCPDIAPPSGDCSDAFASRVWPLLPATGDVGSANEIKDVKTAVMALIPGDQEAVTRWEGVRVHGDRSLVLVVTKAPAGHLQHQLRMRRVDGRWLLVNDDPHGENNYNPS